MSTEAAAGALKLVTGSVAAGGGLVYAVAAGLGEVPTPTTHNAFELLALASIAYIWTQINGMKKKDSTPPMQPTDTQPPNGNSGEKKTANDWLLERLERIAFGVDKGNSDLTDHRVEFAEFRGETTAQLSGLTQRVDRLERRRTDEIPRPS